MVVAILCSFGLATAYVIEHASNSVDIENCKQDLSQKTLERTVARLGEPHPERWRFEASTAGSGKIVWVPDAGASVVVYPDTLVPALGCSWDHRITVRYPEPQGVASPLLLGATTLAFLVLAIAHKGTRQLLLWQSITSAWRLPGWVLVAVSGLMAVQVWVSLQFPGFLKDIGDHQEALLGSSGVLAVLMLAPLAEELWFRATALRELADHGNPRSGLIITSLVFGAMHGMVSSDWRVVLYHWTVLALLGFVLGAVWLRTRNWASCALLHYLNNLPAMITLIAA